MLLLNLSTLKKSFLQKYNSAYLKLSKDDNAPLGLDNEIKLSL